MATLIKTDGTEVTIRPAARNNKWTLKELQTAIGGYIQIIIRRKKRMIVDSDGRMKGCQANPKASQLLRRQDVYDERSHV